jgi:DNA-binding transcriptional LysR family regulator
MDLTHLRTFVAVAEERHLTRAADRLHISQPTASGHIRALETALDITLFDRTNRGLELTNAGSVLVQRAKRILDEASTLASLARELHGQPSGALTVSSNADPELSRLGAIAERLRTTHPLLHLQVHARNSAATLQGVRNGELDAGFLIGEPVEGGLECLLLCAISYRVAGPMAWGNELRDADWQTLARMPWITSSRGNAYSRMMRRLFDDKALTLNGVAEADNDRIIRSMIKAGVGISLVREDEALEAERRGEMSLSTVARISTSLLFVLQSSRHADPLLQALVAGVRAVWALQEAHEAR